MKDAEKTANSSLKNIQNSASGPGGVWAKIGNAATSAANAMKGGFSGVASTLAKIGPIGVAVAGTITLIGTAVYGVFNAVGKLTTKLDSIGKAAKSVNMSAEAYLSLQHAASRTGVEMDKVIDIIGKIDFALVHAADGEKKYRDAFYAIGLSWRDLERLSPEKRLMAIADAMNRIKSSNGSIPKELYDALGRRGVQELNKIAEDANFSKYVAEASALGFGIDEKTIRNAEAYKDAVSDTQQKMLATVAALENQLGLSERLKKVWESLSDKIGKSTGFVDEAYADSFTGIGNEAKKIFTSRENRQNLTDEQKRKLLYSIYSSKDLLPSILNGSGTSFAGTFGLTSEQIDKEFEKALTYIDWSNLKPGLRQALFEVVEEFDKTFRFKANDKSTWIQPILNPEEDEKIRKERLEIAKITDSLDDYNNAILKEIENYEQLKSVVNGVIDVEKELARLRAKLKEVDPKADFDKDIVKEIRDNAEKSKRLRIQKEIEDLQTYSDNADVSFYSEVLSRYGADKSTVDALLKSLQKIGGVKEIEDFIVTNYTQQGGYKQLAEDLQDGIFKINDSNNISIDQAEKLEESFTNTLGKATALKDIINKINLEKLLDDADRTYTLAVANLENNKYVAEYIEKINALNKLGIAVNERNLAAYSEQLDRLIDISRATEEINNKAKFVGNAESDRSEVAILDQKIRGNQQIVHLLELQNELRKQGIAVNEENLATYRKELEELLRQQSRVKTVALKGDLFERTKDNKVNLYKAMGDETRSNRLQLLMSAEKTAGRPLNQYETTLVNRLADITGSINRFAIPQPRDGLIHTNELAAKGGFSKSVAVERADNGKLQLRMQQAIHRLFIENNKLQQKIAESLVN